MKKASGTFTGIPHFVHKSREWAALSPTQKALLTDISCQYSKYNNGDLTAALSVLQKFGWKNQGTISKNIKVLIDRGFLIVTRKRKQRQCALYAVSWHLINDCKGKHKLGETRQYINQFMKISCNKKRQSKGS